MTNQKDGREIVLDMLIELNKDDEFSHRVLGRTLRRYQDKPKQERAFISRLFTGTVKHYLTLDYCIEQFSSLPVRKDETPYRQHFKTKCLSADFYG